MLLILKLKLSLIIDIWHLLAFSLLVVKNVHMKIPISIFQLVESKVSRHLHATDCGL